MDIGRHPLPEEDGSMIVGSTDMGNISYAVPSIHPMIEVALEGTPIHTPEFEVFTGGEEGDRAVIDGALTLALTMVDCLASADTREEIRFLMHGYTAEQHHLASCVPLVDPGERFTAIAPRGPICMPDGDGAGWWSIDLDTFEIPGHNAGTLYR